MKASYATIRTCSRRMGIESMWSGADGGFSDD
jgi:hypothetical protein